MIIPAFDPIGFALPLALVVIGFPLYIQDRLSIRLTIITACLVALQFSLPSLQSWFQGIAQTIGPGPTTGIRAYSLFPVLYMILGGRSFASAWTGAFLSITIADVGMAFWLAQDPLMTVTIGADHWLDQLMLSPLLALLATGLVRLIELHPDGRNFFNRMQRHVA